MKGMINTLSGTPGSDKACTHQGIFRGIVGLKMGCGSHSNLKGVRVNSSCGHIISSKYGIKSATQNPKMIVVTKLPKKPSQVF
eukprot:22546_5